MTRNIRRLIRLASEALGWHGLLATRVRGAPPTADRTPAPQSGARHRHGNAVIEACLVIPILLLLAFGTVEFGHFFFVKHNLQGAAREGVRAAIVSGATNADVTTAVSATMTAAGLQTSGYTVTTNPTNISTAPEGANISVTIACPWGDVGIRPMGMISASKPVAATTVMRKE